VPQNQEKGVLQCIFSILLISKNPQTSAVEWDFVPVQQFVQGIKIS
jgi:hypothetical protein